MKQFTFTNIFDKKSYTVAAINDNFILCDDNAPAGQKCKYTVKVKPDNEYTFKVQKTQIKAINGAEGLVNYIERCYKDGIMECYVNTIIDVILTGKVKEAAA